MSFELSLHVCMLSCFSHVRLFDALNCSLLGSSVHGILQARILEWVTMPFSKGSSQPRDWTHTSYISCVNRRVLYHWHVWQITSLVQQHPQLCDSGAPFKSHWTISTLKFVVYGPWGLLNWNISSQKLEGLKIHSLCLKTFHVIWELPSFSAWFNLFWKLSQE